jgi:hypothetical protein
LNSFPNIVIVGAGFAVVGGAEAVKLWRPLSVTTNYVTAILFLCLVITKNTNILSLLLEKKISQQNPWILLRGGP